MGLEWARAQNRAVQLQQAAHHDDTKTMPKLIDSLVVALASNKNLAKHSAAAVKAFADFQDDRQLVTAAYSAAEGGALGAIEATKFDDVAALGLGAAIGQPQPIRAECWRGALRQARRFLAVAPDAAVATCPLAAASFSTPAASAALPAAVPAAAAVAAALTTFAAPQSRRLHHQERASRRGRRVVLG